MTRAQAIKLAIDALKAQRHTHAPSANLLRATVDSQGITWTVAYEYEAPEWDGSHAGGLMGGYLSPEYVCVLAVEIGAGQWAHAVEVLREDVLRQLENDVLAQINAELRDAA